ncbi:MULTISPECIES: M14 family metallopeptidase [Roseococcus]|jgi:light-harvesting complex 1 beta chain|uniref:light-harvesting protein n=1 Tax=Roseococcus TaxID=35812 RepID=UPI00168AA323|nr:MULTISPECIES: light-harvesting protein [Roseococcus]
MAEVIARAGLTEPEAREVHRLVMQGWIFSVFASMGAHILVWMWRPLVYGSQVVPPDWRFFIN